MRHVELDGTPVDYELTGDGDTVVLPHARPFGCWYEPLVANLGAWRVLRYSRPAGPGLTIRFVPGATAEALVHADGFFAAELPAVIATTSPRPMSPASRCRC